MDTQQEQINAPLLRALARQYSEGRFNKEEYRTRRRDLVVQCTGEPSSIRYEKTERAFSSAVTGQTAVAVSDPAPSLVPLFVGFAAMVIGMLGVLSFFN